MWQFWGKKPQSTTAEGVFLLLIFCLEAKYSKIPFVGEGNFMWITHTMIGFSTGEQWFFSLGKKFWRCKKIMQKMGTEASRVLGFRTWIHVLHLLGTSLQAGQFNRTVGKVGENMSKTLQLEGDFLWLGSYLFFIFFGAPLDSAFTKPSWNWKEYGR